MKKILILLTTVLTLVSCESTRQLTQEEFREMTTTQYDTDFNTVYSATMSALQTDGYIINNTDKNSGLINATKEVHNNKSELELFFVGLSTTSTHNSISVFIDDITPNLTEVKLTIYEGYTDTTEDGKGTRNQTTSNKLSQKSEVYSNIFHKIHQEINRRKSVR